MNNKKSQLCFKKSVTELLNLTNLILVALTHYNMPSKNQWNFAQMKLLRKNKTSTIQKVDVQQDVDIDIEMKTSNIDSRYVLYYI